MAKIKIALEIENRQQLEQLELQLKKVREQVAGIKPEKIKVDVEPLDQVQVDKVTRQVNGIRKQTELIDKEKHKIYLEPIAKKESVPRIHKDQPVIIDYMELEKEQIKKMKDAARLTQEHETNLRTITPQKDKPAKTERIDAEEKERFKPVKRTQYEPITEDDIDIAEKRMNQIRDMVVSIEPQRIKNVVIAEDQEEAVIALGKRIKDIGAAELNRVRLSKEQLDMLKKQNIEARMTLQSDIESIKAKKESAGWFERSDMEELERLNKTELVQERILGRRLHYIEGVQKAETRATAEMDRAAKAVSGRQTVLGGIATGTMQGMGLGRLMKITPALAAAYGAYKTIQFVGQSMGIAGNFMANLDRLTLLTGQIADSAQKEIPMWRKRAITMGIGVNQSIELSKYTAETVGYTKSHTKEMEYLGKELKIRGRDVVRELPVLIEMIRRSPGMTLGSQFIHRMESYAGTAGIAQSRIYSQFLPMIQAYQNIMFSRGVQIPAETLMKQAAGIAQFGESFRGQQGANILAGLSQTFMAGGGAGESGKGLIYRALMAKGMDYYGIHKAMSSGNVMAHIGDIIKEIKTEYGDIKPGTMGLLSLQSLFPNLSIQQWERIMKNYKEGSPFDIDKAKYEMLSLKEPDTKEREFMKTYLKSSIQSQVEKEIFQDAVAGGLEKWWTEAKGTVFGWINKQNPLERLLKSDEERTTESLMKYLGWAATKSPHAEHYDVGISGMNRGVR